MVFGAVVNVRKAQSPNSWQLAFASSLSVRTMGVASEYVDEEPTNSSMLCTTL
jgi:hypothetical protein